MNGWWIAWHSSVVKRLVLVLSGLAILVLVSAVLFPVFAKAPWGKDATLLDGDLRPIVGARLSMEDGSEVVTDSRGQFDLPRAMRGPVGVKGRVVAERMHHSGGNPGVTYTYSRRGGYVISFVTSGGSALPCSVDVSVMSPVWNQRLAGQMRHCAIRDLPIGLATRWFLFCATSPDWRLARVDRSCSGSEVSLVAVFRKLPGHADRRVWSSFDGRKTHTWSY